MKQAINGRNVNMNMKEEMLSHHHDDQLAVRKTQEAAARRYQATRWLREMDQVAWVSLSKEPSEEDFCLALRNGLILCNVLNKLHPGAVAKVVENPVDAVQSTEGGAQSAIQYFENMRNFLVAVSNMKLLTFEASDLEKGGSSSKVVDCILCLKGYYEWKQAGGIGVWRYGGTVRITSYPKDYSSSSVGSESADESSVDESDLSQYEHISQFLRHSAKVLNEEKKAAKALSSLFDRFGLHILQAYILRNDIDELPLNSMVIDTVIRKVVKDLSAMLVSQGVQLGTMLKKVVKSETTTMSKEEFLEAISQYLSQRTSMKTNDLCVCGGRIENIQKEDTCPKDYKDVIYDQQKQLCELRSSFEVTKQDVRKTQFEWNAEIKKLETHVRSLEVASSSYYKVLEENRRLYNQVQDLKGAIRVYCRVRPFVSGHSDGKSTVEYIGEDGNLMIIHPHKQGRDARRIFSFNKVFGTNTSQQQIYADTQPLIRSVLDGYNVCIFAYGQTGSGKTYTMSGPDLTTEDTWGVNYRALTDLFQISKSRSDMIEYEIGVQMIEIYNEQVRDLLVVDGSSRKLDIRNNSQLNGLNVPDASLVKVNCTQDVLELMKIGLKNRAVGATTLNERSSRSHSILTIHVQGKELNSGSVLKGCLHLVDLAGSERVDKSEAVGERLKEAQHINKSLSALGDVISALAQKSAHIPYRNSKLTQVLQDSLGGQAKTLMLVHINPETNAIGETISTLKFAERVASIELGAARANKETSEIRDLKAEISNLKSMIEKKEAELEHLKSANTKSNTEAQKGRAASPVHVPKIGRAIDDKTFEVRSCPSGKQRRSRLPFSTTENEAISRMPFIAEEKLTTLANPRSPSPPIRRSMSTDRGALIRSRLRPDTTEKPIAKPQFPVRFSVNKSVNVETVDVLSSVQRANLKKVQPSQDNEEQPSKVLSVRQMTVRKSKQENKPKIKNQLPPRVSNNDGFSIHTNTDVGGNVEEEAEKSDFSEPENDVFGSPVYGASKLKKTRQQNSTRCSQYIEPRGLPLHTVESITSGMMERKIPVGMSQNPKDSSNSMLELRRSRSTPRGKFFFLP